MAGVRIEPWNEHDRPLWRRGYPPADTLELPAPYAARIASLRRLMDALDFEIGIFDKLAPGRLAKDPGTG